MARPQPYKLADGARAPSVTTILSGIGWNKEVLMRWANRIGLEEGKSLDDAREAADIGTIVHAMIEGFRKGEAVDLGKVPDALREPAETAYRSFLRWSDGSVQEPLGVELRMVSENHRFGGTCDYVYRNKDSKVCLLDYKTSAGVYVDHLLQVCGYGLLWDDAHPEMPIELYETLRLSKVSGAFEHASYPAAKLKPFGEAFLVARKLHDYRGQLEKMMR